jgi:hypothetical protein
VNLIFENPENLQKCSLKYRMFKKDPNYTIYTFGGRLFIIFMASMIEKRAFFNYLQHFEKKLND